MHKFLKTVRNIALELYREFIDNCFQDMRFMSKNFLEDLLNQIRSLRGDLTDSRIAAILYDTYDGSETTKFAVLKATKFKNANSVIDEALLDNWFFNLKHEYPTKIFNFLNIINKYKKKCAKKHVFNLVKKWDSYCSKVEGLGLNMETTNFEFIESVLKGNLIENMSFELSCEDVFHEKFVVSYKKLYRAVCPLCSRIRRSYSYQDFVLVAELKNATFGLSESEFNQRIIEEFNKPRNEQLKISEILFLFICRRHGEFYISMERIKDYNNWCADCYHESTRLTGEEIKVRGNKYNFNLEKPLDYINSLSSPSREAFKWSCMLHPTFSFTSKCDEYSLDLKSCDICSGGKITNERIVRYLLSRLFKTNFGEKQTLLYTILPFNDVFNLLPNDYNSIRSYNHMHFDAFSYININIEGEIRNLSVAVEYWDREHSSPEEHADRFKRHPPRRASHLEDYLHLKSSDDFKQSLKDNMFIHIYIVIDHTIGRDNFLHFIVSEFEAQIRELFNIDFSFTSVPNCNWRDLKQVDELRRTFGDIIRFL